MNMRRTARKIRETEIDRFLHPSICPWVKKRLRDLLSPTSSLSLWWPFFPSCLLGNLIRYVESVATGRAYGQSTEITPSAKPLANVSKETWTLGTWEGGRISICSSVIVVLGICRAGENGPASRKVQILGPVTRKHLWGQIASFHPTVCSQEMAAKGHVQCQISGRTSAWHAEGARFNS